MGGHNENTVNRALEGFSRPHECKYKTLTHGYFNTHTNPYLNVKLTQTQKHKHTHTHTHTHTHAHTHTLM